MFSNALVALLSAQQPRDKFTVTRVSGRILWSGLAFLALALLLLFGIPPRPRVMLTVFSILLFINTILAYFMLWLELRQRSSYRKHRLALCTFLADGLAAGELANPEKFYYALSTRMHRESCFSIKDLESFDCIVHDLLYTNPDLSIAVREISAREAGIA